MYARGRRSLIQADFHYDGQHQRRSLKTTDRSVAVERALELEARIQTGTFEQGRQVGRTRSLRNATLAYALEVFVDGKLTNGVRPKTISKYAGTLRGFAAFAARGGVIRVGRATLPLVDAYRAWRRTVVVRGRLVGPAQMYHDAALLKQFFKWCADRGMTASNPLANQRFHKPTPRRCQRVLTLDQINAVLATLPERSRGPVAVLAFAGMRSSDCRNLMVDDVDLDAGWVYVRSRDGAPTKCGNEWKTPIHPRLEAVLRTLSLPAGGYLFNASPSPRHPLADLPINTKLLNEGFIKALKELGLPAGRDAGFTIHSLRHFFKSFCICHGAPREYVDAWQGHAGVSRASDLYVHTLDAESRRLMNRVPFGPT